MPYEQSQRSFYFSLPIIISPKKTNHFNSITSQHERYHLLPVSSDLHINRTQKNESGSDPACGSHSFIKEYDRYDAS